MNCLIVDDEPLAQDILESYVSEIPTLQLIKKCSTAIEAFEILHHQQIELLFLDVKMPGLTGIDFIRSLKNPPAVIFTTAFSEYAAMSYDLEAIDYLLKPITFERFKKAVDKFLKLQPTNTIDEKNYTYFKVSGNLIKVLHEDFLYAQSIKDYLLLHTKNGNLIVHMTMKYLCELLPESSFMRVHRSYLVNKFCITAVAKNQLELNGTVIPIGENYRSILDQNNL